MLHRKILLKVNPEFGDIKPFFLLLPELFKEKKGELIKSGRNEIRILDYCGRKYVAKSFKINVLSRLIYCRFRKSKSERSYKHAIALQNIGVGTPKPIGYIDIICRYMLNKSFYVSLLSECKYVYVDIFSKKFEYEDEIIREIGRTTALMHNNGFAHKDFGRGNILFDIINGKVKIELVDLNRMFIGKIDLKRGCKNLERLPADQHKHKLLADEYAKGRGFDANQCYELIRKYRSTQPGKIDTEGF